MKPPIEKYDYRFLKLLRLAPFERRPGGWRFGIKPIADRIVERLVASGRASSDGATVWLATLGSAE
jgi:hypothetical protein